MPHCSPLDATGAAGQAPAADAPAFLAPKDALMQQRMLDDDEIGDFNSEDEALTAG